MQALGLGRKQALGLRVQFTWKSCQTGRDPMCLMIGPSCPGLLLVQERGELQRREHALHVLPGCCAADVEHDLMSFRNTEEKRREKN